jgi:hypothetical protein
MVTAAALLLDGDETVTVPVARAAAIPLLEVADHASAVA